MLTSDDKYTDLFVSKQNAWWKILLPVQVPYRYNVRRLCRGRVLDVGCGTGRHLRYLKLGSIGIDHNTNFVSMAIKNGCKAYLPNQFRKQFARNPYLFDTMLFSHVIEHLQYPDALKLVNKYLYALKDNGHIVFIVPQLAGFKTDPTHVTFFDEKMLKEIVSEIKFKVLCLFSYPFPKIFGNIFFHNELIVVAKRQ